MLRLIAPTFIECSGTADAKTAEHFEAWLAWIYNHDDLDLSKRICDFICLYGELS